MRVLCQVVGISVLLVGIQTLRSDDQDVVRALLDKAIKAHGGEANLRKYPALSLKGNGTIYTMGEGHPFMGAWAMQGPSQSRFAMEFKIMGISFNAVSVLNGDKAWFSINDGLLDVGKEELTAEKKGMYAVWVTRLFPLKEKNHSFQFAPLGEIKIGDKTAVGLKVAKRGQPDVNLFFDKISGLLVKSEWRVHDARVSDQEFLQENYYQEYKEVRGNQYATKLLAHKDGKPLMEVVLSEIQPLEKLDESIFSKP